MSRSPRALLVVLVLAAAGCGGGGGGGAAPTNAISGTISGPVVAGIAVSLGGDATSTTATDSAGNYTFTGLASGNYTVTPTAQGYTFSPLARAVVVAGASLTGENFTSAVAHFVSGRVATASAGLPGVTVTMDGKAATTTDAMGSYAFSSLPNGTYVLVPGLEGYVFSPTSLTATVAGANSVGNDFLASPNAAPTHSISGAVSGAAGQTVTLTLSGAAAATTATDSSGNFSFPGLVNGSYTVTPSLAGSTFTPPSAAVTVNGTDVSGVNFAAQGGAYLVSGKVTLSGVGLPGVAVTLNGTTTVSTDSTGAYSFPGLSNGTYEVVPALAGYVFSPSSLTATVSGASSTGDNFAATLLTYGISGSVSGAARQGVTVTLGGAKSASTLTGPSGNYSFSGLANGAYTVTPSLSGGYVFTPSTLSVTVSGASVPNQNFTDLGANTVSGKVAVAGVGLPGVTVTLNGTTAVTTDSTGSYFIQGLPNGTYGLVPSLSGYVFSPVSLTIVVSGNSAGNDFSASPSTAPTYTISGAVPGASGFKVTLSGSAGASTLTDSSGNYSFPGLTSGTYTVTPSESGYTFSPPSASVTVTSADVTNVNFTATALPTYTIGGTVTGGIVQGVTVALAGAASASTVTNGSGDYSFAGLYAGAYTVTPSASGYAFTPASIALSLPSSSAGSVNFVEKASVTTFTSVINVPLPGAATVAQVGIVSGAPSVVWDQAPGAGDLLAPVVGNDGYWYLYASQDGGQTWSYIKAPTPGTLTHTGGICQDSVNYDLHLVLNDSSNLYYSRIKLVRDSNGHVTAFTWDANQVLIGPAASDADATDVRFQIVDAVNGLGNHELVLAYLYDPSPPSYSSALAMWRTNGVTPAQTSDFVGLDGGSSPTAVASTPNDATCGYWNIHDLLIGLAQHPVTHSLYLFRGPAGDPASCLGTANQQSIVLWTYSPVSASPNFALSNTAAGQVVSAGTSSQVAHWGGTFPTEDSIWVAYYSPTGPQFDRVLPDGTYRSQVLPNPDQYGSVAGYVSIAVKTGQTEAWATWLGSTPAGAYTDTYSGHWNGGAWDSVRKVSCEDTSGFGSSLYWRGGLVVVERSDTGYFDQSSPTCPNTGDVPDPYVSQIQVIRTTP